MDLDQLLAEISKHPTSAVLEKLKGNPIYQAIFNDGHRVATGQSKDDLSKKDQEITTLKKSRDDLQTEFDKFKEKNPSAAELQRQYSEAIAAKDKEIQQVKDAQTAERKKFRIDDVLTRIQSKLSEVIDPEIAEAKAEKLRNRIQLPDGTTVQIMQAGQQIPFAGDLDAQITSVVEEVRKATPERLHRSDVIEGSGRDRAAGGSGNGKKEFFQNIRKSVQKPDTPEGQPSTQDQLNSRMGLRQS